MKCCFTGHRDIAEDKLPDLRMKLDDIIETLSREGVDEFITGGALGFDTLAAQEILKNRKKLTIVVPFKNMAKSWNDENRTAFYDILEKADSVLYVNEKYNRGCYRARNHKMVDMADICVAYFIYSPSGTKQTIDYAVMCNKKVINIAEEK